jgi:nucleoside-diphosphate-sugar epimerase
LPLTEDESVIPVDANGVSKHAAEMYYALYYRAYGIPSVVLRMTNTYGPRMNLRGSGSGFVGRFLQSALTGSRIDVFGDGRQRRDFNYVDDVVDALLRAGQAENIAGQVFNLGHTEHHSVLDLVHLLQHLSGVSYRLMPYPEDYAAIEVGDCYCDFSRFRAATGWLPRHNLATGLSRTWSWFQGHIREFPSLGECHHDSGVRSTVRVLAAEAGN